MTWLLTIILVLLALLVQVNTLEENQCDDLGVVLSTHDNHTTPFNSLQEALDIVLQNGSQLEVPTICLPPGTHQIIRPLEFGLLSLRLVGCKNSTTVACDYETQHLWKNGIDFTWHFNQSQELQLQDIDFLNCPYPFRVIAVKTVTVKKCTFK